MNCLVKIKGLYSKQGKLQHQDQFIFKTPIEQWEERSVTQMKGWIKRNSPYIKYCAKMEYEQAKLHKSDIRGHFQKGTTQPQHGKTMRTKRKEKIEMRRMRIELFGRGLKQTTTISKRRRVRQKREYYNELERPPEAGVGKTQTNL